MRQSNNHLGYHTFGKLLYALDESGYAAKSDSLLEEAIQIALENSDPYWRPRLLYHLAICLTRKGRIEQARSLIFQVDAASEPRIYAEQPEALGEIALSLARSALRNEAEAAFTQSLGSVRRMADYGIQEREARADTLNQVAKLMCEAGYVTQAREATFMIEYGSNNHAVQRLATALIQLGSYAEAFQIIGTDLSRQFSSTEPDEFLQTLSEWSPYFNSLRPRLSLAVLQEAVRIMGWVFTDRKEMYNVLGERQV